MNWKFCYAIPNKDGNRNKKNKAYEIMKGGKMDMKWLDETAVVYNNNLH